MTVSRPRAELAALALLALAALALCWPFLLGGQAFYFYDSAVYLMPLLHWSHHSLAGGIEPAWDASVLCGVSAFDNSMGLCLYPPLRLFGTLADAVPAEGWIIYSHLVLAAWGAYALVRSRGLGPGPALAGALTAAFAGGMVYSPAGIPMLVSQAWFPWMLLGLLLCQDAAPRRRWLGAAVLGLSTGYSFQGGYPGMAFYSLLVLGLFQSLWLAQRPRRWADGGAWLALALAALVTGLLYAGQAQALQRGAAQSQRGAGLSVEQAEEGSLSPATLGGLLLPHALGRSADDSYSGASWRFGTYDPTGMYLYVGLGSLVLLLAGLRWRWRQAWPWALAWGLLVFYALGKWNPLFPLLLRLPVLGYLRCPDKAVLFSGTLAAMPVAYGLTALAERPTRAPARWAAALAAGLGLGLLALWLGWDALMRLGARHIEAHLLGDPLHTLPLQAYLGRLTRLLLNLRWQLGAQAAWAALIALALWAGWRWRLGALGLALLLAPLLFGELAMNARAQWVLIDRAYYDTKPASVAWLEQHQDPSQPVRAFSWGYLAAYRRLFPEGRPQGRLVQELQLNEVLQVNSPSSWGLDMANGYAPLWPKRLQPLLGWMKVQDPDLEGASLQRLRSVRRALDLASARWLVSAVPLDLPGLALRRDGDVRIYENLRCLPMAYIAGHSRGGYDQASAWAALSVTGTAEGRWARPALLEDGSAPALGRGSVAWGLKRADAWELQAQVDSPQGVLVLSRAYYPGPWSATVDGQAAPLVAVNAAFCAVHLAQGAHRVRVFYQDPLLQRAQRWQAAGLLLALALLLWAWRSPREPA